MKRALFFLACLSSAATGWALTPASIKAAGMGGADVAFVEDALCSFDNPANAGMVCDRLDLGMILDGTHKKLRISNRVPNPFGIPAASLQSGTFKPKDERHVWTSAGVNIWASCNTAIGIQYNNYENFYTRYGVRLQDFAPTDVNGNPTGPNTRFEYDVNVATGAVAYRFNDRNSIGLALNVYVARFNVAGVGGLGQAIAGLPGPLSAFPDSVSDRGKRSATGVGVTLGWVGHFTDSLAFGISYSPKVTMTRFHTFEGFLPDHRLSIPETVRLGVAWDVKCNFTVAVDGEWREFRRVHSLSNKFPSDSTAGLGSLFGTDRGPGFGWRNQWLVKLGLNWEIDEAWVVRAGYRHENIPLRHGEASALNALILHTVQDYITLGATWVFYDAADLSLFGEYGFTKGYHSRLPNISQAGVVQFVNAKLKFTESTYRAGLAVGYCF